MNRRTVLTKTAKGLMEVTGKTSLLARDVRNVLSQVDGKATVGDLHQKLDKFSEAKLIEALGKLDKDGFVREFVSAPASISPPSQVPIVQEDVDLDFTALISKPASKTAVTAQARAEADDVAQQVAQARARQEADARVKAEADTRAKVEAEARARARREAEEKAKQEAAERGRREAEEQARRTADEKGRREAEERSRREAEARARAEGDARARRDAEDAARRAAEEQARRAVAERAKRDSGERAQATAQFDREAEERSRREADARARQEAEARARREAGDRAQRDQEERIRRELEDRVRQAEEQARRESAERARRDAEERGRREADSRALREAEERGRREAEQRFSREAGERARREEEEEERREAAEDDRDRREAERAGRAEDKARAKADAEAAARARRDERTRDKAEADTRASARRREEEKEHEKNAAVVAARLEKLRAGKKSSFGKTLGIALAVLMVAGLVYLQFFLPLDLAQYERLAARRVGQPVKIKTGSISLFPSPAVRLENVTVGQGGNIRIAVVNAHPDFASVMSDQPQLKSIDLQGVTLDAAGLGSVLFGRVQSAALGLEQVRATGIKLVVPGVSLPELEATASLQPDGNVQKIVVGNPNKTIAAEIRPQGSKALVELTVGGATALLGLPFEVESLSARGVATTTEFSVSEFDAKLLDGVVRGKGRLRWPGGLAFDATFELKQVDAKRISPFLVGRVQGTGIVTTQGDSLEKLGPAARLAGNFVVSKGQISGVDLARTLQSGKSAAGSTTFNEFSAQAQLDQGRLALRSVKLDAGALSANGTIDVDGSKSIAGQFRADMKTPGGMVRATLAVSGTADQLVIKR